ncbi:hypothetical protein EXT46_06900 [Pseudoalteromonas sp. CO325X]|uniref:hypothetical protein n=1 Tax=Pseudoalteromonas sp. CO325X TaxID=1777262 RepID=UPI001023A470|nr:hypothetical protein [Pseudoalteromonas sp. CO325X]RZF83170.1 hypothetical protein EXT46_06900 [Pseudoalteromonas sp. CO325X]
MNVQESSIEQVVDNIVKAMESSQCKMISAAIIVGNVCSGSQHLLSLKDKEVVLQKINDSIDKFGSTLSVVIQTNYFVWAVDEAIRTEIFKNDELSVKGMMPIIADGGLGWYMQEKSSDDKADLSGFFAFIKSIFLECSKGNPENHESYDDIIEVLDGIIAVI